MSQHKTILNILIPFVLYLSGYFTIYEYTYYLANGSHRLILLGFFSVFALSLLYSNHLIVKATNEKLIYQFALILCVLSLSTGLVACSILTSNFYCTSSLSILIPVISVISISLFIIDLIVYFKIRHESLHSYISCITDIVRNEYGLLIIIASVLILCIIQHNTQPKWDSANIYEYIYNLPVYEAFNLHSTSFWQHLCQSYCGINLLLSALFQDLYLGMSVGNTLLFLYSVICIYKIIIHIFPDMCKIQKYLLVLIYALSPFTLGMVGYNYWDQWTIYIQIILVFCYLYEYWGLFFTWGIVLCFTKEPAVVSFAGMCLGLLIIGLIKHKSIVPMLKQSRWYVTLAIGLSWLYMYLTFPTWSDDGSVSINLVYILSKLKVFFLLNFNWLLTLVTIIGVIYIVLTRDIRIINIVFPILLSDVLLVIFNCCFMTINHARYMDGHISSLIILAVIGIGLIRPESIRYFLSICISIILLLANYWTIDPVTIICFDNYNAGNSTIISTVKYEKMSDSMVYNQQYLFIEKVINYALTDVVADDSIIIFPLINDNSRYFEGNYHGASKGTIVAEYFNTKKNTRSIYANSDTIEFPLVNIECIDDIPQTSYANQYFFSLPFAGNDILNDLREAGKVLDEKEYSFMGFVLNRARIK